MKSYSVKRIQAMTEENKFSFAIEIASDSIAADKQGSAMGFVGITRPPEIFYIFDENHWGRGYATEALKAFLVAYWERYPAGLPDSNDVDPNLLEAHVDDGNQASESVLVKCGFVHASDALATSHGRNDVATKIFQLKRPI
jgi:RimJ/RimL family protein N-acetyltransferase